MKRILISLCLILITFLSYGQVEQHLGTVNTKVIAKNVLQVDSLFVLPHRTDTTFTPYRAGAIIFRPADAKPYYWNGTSWQGFGGAAETDPTVSAVAKTISTGDTSNWNTASRKRIVSALYDSTTKIFSFTLGDGSTVGDTIKVANNFPSALSITGGIVTLNRTGMSALTAAISTSVVPEGTNQYFTVPRVRSSLSSGSSLLSYNSTTGVIGLNFTTADTTRWGAGNFTQFNFTNANGISGLVTNATTTPTLSLSIDPLSITDSKIFDVDWSKITNKPAFANDTIVLTGDVTGTGYGGSIATTLSATGVVPGIYYNSNLTVGADGRIIAITDGTSGSGSSGTIETISNAGTGYFLVKARVGSEYPIKSLQKDYGILIDSNLTTITIKADTISSNGLATQSDLAEVSAAGLSDGDKGDITVTGTTTWTIDNNAVVTAKINDGAVTNAKLANSTIAFNAPGTTGLAPNYSASPISLGGSVQLNIPMASTASVTAGLLSNTKYTEFNNKIGGIAGESYLSVLGTSIVAGSVDLSGTHVTGIISSARIAGTATAGYVPKMVGGVVTWQPDDNGSGGIMNLDTVRTSSSATILATGTDAVLLPVDIGSNKAGIITPQMKLNWDSVYLGTKKDTIFTSGALTSTLNSNNKDSLHLTNEPASPTNGTVFGYTSGAWAMINFTASNGLTRTGNDFHIGGTLTSSPTINAGTNTLIINGTTASGNGVLQAANTSSGAGANISSNSGAGLVATSVSGSAVAAQSTSGYALYGISSSAPGVRAESAGSYAGAFVASAGSGIVSTATQWGIVLQSSGASTYGMIQGSSTGGTTGLLNAAYFTRDNNAMLNDGFLFRFAGKDGAGTNVEFGDQHIIVTDPAAGSVDADYVWRLISASSMNERMRLKSDGTLKLNTYGDGTHTGTETWIAAWDADGNFVEVDPDDLGGGGAGSPAGSNTEIQYNNAGSFGASSNFTFNSGVFTVKTANSGFVMREYTDNTSYFSIYSSEVTPNGENFIISAKDDGTELYMNGSSSAGLYVAGLPQVLVNSSGVQLPDLGGNGDGVVGVDDDGLLYWTSIAATSSGTYIPDVDAVSNVSAITVTRAHYLRVGNVVTVAGSFLVTSGSSSGTTEIRFDLPVASNIAQIYDVAGTATCQTAADNPGSWSASVANDQAVLTIVNPGSTTQQTYYYTYTYYIDPS